MPCSKPSIFMTWQCGLTQILRSLGRDFPVCTRFFTLIVATRLPLAAMLQRQLWKMRRDYNLTQPKPCSSPAIINIGCCTIPGWPKPPSNASAKNCRVTARSYTRSQQLREARDIGLKVLPIGNGASPSIREIRPYLLKWHLHTRRFDDSRQRKTSTIEHWIFFLMKRL